MFQELEALEQDLGEDRALMIALENIKLKSFMSIMDLVYNGHTEGTSEETTETMKCAERLQIDFGSSISIQCQPTVEGIPDEHLETPENLPDEEQLFNIALDEAFVTVCNEAAVEQDAEATTTNVETPEKLAEPNEKQQETLNRVTSHDESRDTFMPNIVVSEESEEISEVFTEAEVEEGESIDTLEKSSLPSPPRKRLLGQICKTDYKENCKNAEDLSPGLASKTTGKASKRKSARSQKKLAKISKKEHPTPTGNLNNDPACQNRENIDLERCCSFCRSILATPGNRVRHEKICKKKPISF